MYFHILAITNRKFCIYQKSMNSSLHLLKSYLLHLYHHHHHHHHHCHHYHHHSLIPLYHCFWFLLTFLVSISLYPANFLLLQIEYWYVSVSGNIPVYVFGIQNYRWVFRFILSEDLITFMSQSNHIQCLKTTLL